MSSLKNRVKFIGLLLFLFPLVSNASCVTRHKTAYNASMVALDKNGTYEKNLYVVIGSGSAERCGWRKKKKASVAAAGKAATNLKNNWHDMIADQGLKVAARELCNNGELSLYSLFSSANTGYSSPSSVYSRATYQYKFYRC